jgi:uncharacterized protein (DUF1499 family)
MIFLYRFSAILLLLIVSGCAGSMPKNIGITDNKLSPCPDKPNCVNSFSNTKEHRIQPFSPASNQLWKNLIQVLNEQKNSKIIISEPLYIHATFTSKLMGFVDDVEFLQSNNTTHIRSASRLGYSDLGANRDRIERLRSQLFNK